MTLDDLRPYLEVGAAVVALLTFVGGAVAGTMKFLGPNSNVVRWSRLIETSAGLRKESGYISRLCYIYYFDARGCETPKSVSIEFFREAATYESFGQARIDEPVQRNGKFLYTIRLSARAEVRVVFFFDTSVMVDTVLCEEVPLVLIPSKDLTFSLLKKPLQ